MDLNIISKFFVDEVYLRLLLVTISLFVIGFFTWFMYTRLSKRDLFKIKSPGKGISWSDKAIYILKYIFFFPFFTIALEFALRTYYIFALKSKQPSRRAAAQEEAA